MTMNEAENENNLVAWIEKRNPKRDFSLFVEDYEIMPPHANLTMAAQAKEKYLQHKTGNAGIRVEVLMLPVMVTTIILNRDDKADTKQPVSPQSPTPESSTAIQMSVERFNSLLEYLHLTFTGNIEHLSKDFEVALRKATGK